MHAYKPITKHEMQTCNIFYYLSAWMAHMYTL